MSHYHEQREEDERNQVMKRAEKHNRTYDEQVAAEEHDRKFEAGKKLYDKMLEDQGLIAFYLNHRKG